jgi:hypothetical protein
MMSSLCFFSAARTSSATSGDAGLDVSIPATTLAPNTGDIGLKLTLLAVRRFLLIDDMLLLRRRALPAAGCRRRSCGRTTRHGLFLDSNE